MISKSPTRHQPYHQQITITSTTSPIIQPQSKQRQLTSLDIYNAIFEHLVFSFKHH